MPELTEEKKEEIRKQIKEEWGVRPAVPPEKAFETLELFDAVSHECFNVNMHYSLYWKEGQRVATWQSNVRCSFEIPPYPPGKCVAKWFKGANHLEALQNAKKWIDENVVRGDLKPEAIAECM